MLLGLEDGTPLRGDMILACVQRFDLAPMPSTLEATVRIDEGTSALLVDGRVVLAGTDGDRYRIIKAMPVQSNVAVSGRAELMAAVKITAVLDGLEALMRPQARAVVKLRRSIAEVYRACGATVRMGDDVPTVRFVCPVGAVATFGIANLMQQEFVAPVWREKRLSFVRIGDLFKGLPVDKLQTDVAEKTESAWLEQLGSVRGYSTAADGTLVYGGPIDLPRPLMHVARMPERVLNNFGRFLAVRRCLPASYSGEKRAGDLMDLGSTLHVVVTAVHAWTNNADGAGSNQTTRLWLGQVKA